jgi:hypothetical protein
MENQNPLTLTDTTPPLAVPHVIPRPAERRLEPTLVEEPSVRKGTNLHDLPSVWRLDARIDWLIEDMIPLSGVTLLTAASGTGKTWLAYAIGGAVAHGSPFLRCEVKQRPVIYLDGENPLPIAKRNLDGLSIAEIEAFRIWGGWCEAGVPGPADSELIKYAGMHKPLFIWDSLIEFHEGDEQSAKETRAFMKKFRALANAGATVLVLHHTGKSDGSQEYRGSSDIEAGVDMAYLVKGTSRGGTLDRLTMHNFKSRFAPGRDFGMQFQAGRGFEAVEVPQGIQKPSADSVVRKIIAEHPGMNGDSIKELAKTAGVGRNAADRVLKSLPYRKGKGREKLYYPPEAEQTM